MEKASEFDDRESLTLSADQVLAIIMDSDEARGIVETLNRNGFSSEDIGVLTGTEDAEKLDGATGRKGFFAKLLTSGVDMGDRDTDYIKLYRRALLNGRILVGVVARNDESRNKARKILKAGGARFITFFGRFVTEVLEA
jgi:hypothetical protein